MNALLYILFCIAEVGHDYELEKDLLKQGYGAEDNKQRKRWKLIFTGAFAVSISLAHENPLLMFLWSAWAFWFIHELGLAIARHRLDTFGKFGTTSDVDAIINRLGLGVWTMRLLMTAPFIALSLMI